MEKNGSSTTTNILYLFSTKTLMNMGNLENPIP